MKKFPPQALHFAMLPTGRGAPVRARRDAYATTPTSQAGVQRRKSTGVPASLPPQEDDPSHEMHGSSYAAQARRRERERCRAIVSSELGLTQPELAYALAFRTSMKTAEALAAMAAMENGEFGHLNGRWLEMNSRRPLPDSTRGARGVSTH